MGCSPRFTSRSGQGNAPLQAARTDQAGGNGMLARLSVNAILKSVIAALSAVVVIMLAAGAWSSWSRLQVDTRIAGVAATSAHLFTALHNLRSDRSRSYRLLVSDEVVTTKDPRIFESRDAEMPALHG